MCAVLIPGSPLRCPRIVEAHRRDGSLITVKDAACTPSTLRGGCFILRPKASHADRQSAGGLLREACELADRQLRAVHTARSESHDALREIGESEPGLAFRLEGGDRDSDVAGAAQHRQERDLAEEGHAEGLG